MTSFLALAEPKMLYTGTAVDFSIVNALGEARRIELKRRELPQPPTRQVSLLCMAFR
jgi:hypothetical protein